MTFVTKVRAFNIGTGAAASTVTIAHGLGLVPAAIFCHYNTRTEAVDADAAGNIHRGSGFATGAAVQRAVASMARHNVAAPRAAKGLDEDRAVICEIKSDGTAGGRCHVQSWDATNVVFVIDVAFTQSYRVTMQAWGGTDIVGVPVGTLTAPLVIGIQDITGLATGMIPVNNRALLIAISAGGTVANAVHADSTHMLGVAASPVEEYSLLNGGNDANATQSQAVRYSYFGETLSHWNPGVDSVTGRAAFAGWLETGFSLDWIEATGTADLYFYMVLVGPSVALRADETPPDTLGTRAIVGVPFAPLAGLILSDNRGAGAQNIKVDGDAISVGMWDSGGATFGLHSYDQDNLSPSVAHSAIQVDSLYIQTNAAGAVTATMAFVNVTANGANFAMGLGDGTGDQFIAVFFGAAPAVVATGSLCEAVPFNIGTGAAASTVVVNAGFRPKAVQFFAIGRTDLVDTGGRATTRRLLGFAADCAGVIKNRSVMSCSVDAGSAGAYSVDGYNQNDASIITIDDAGVLVGAAAVTSFTETGCIITIADQFPTSLRILAIFYGGSSLTGCAIGTFSLPTAGGLPLSQDITGLGFTCADGEAVGFLIGSGDTSENTAAFDGRVGLGAFVSPAMQAAWAGGSNDSQATRTQSVRYNSRGRCWVGVDTAVTDIVKRVSFDSWIADGFRLRHDEISARAEKMYYMVLKGGRWGLFTGHTPTAVGGITDLGPLGLGTPAGGIMVSTMSGEVDDDSLLTSDMLSLGVYSGLTKRYAVMQRDEDNFVSSTVNTRVEHDQLYGSISTAGALTAAMDLATFAQESVRFVMDVADGAGRFFWTVLFGHSVATAKQYVRMRLLNAPGAGPVVNEVELFERTMEAGGTGSTLSKPARLHPGITHVSPLLIGNWNNSESPDGVLEFDLFMMSLPAGTVPSEFADAVQREMDTILDSDGILLPGVKQNDGSSAQPLVKGTVRGVARHNEQVDFADYGRVFQTIPKVTLRGGLLSQPAAVWGTEAEVNGVGTPNDSVDATKPQYEDLAAIDLDTHGFVLRARLRQKAGGVTGLAQLPFAGVALNTIDATDTRETLTNAPSKNDQYKVRVFGRCELRSQNGAPYSVTLNYVVETTDDSGTTPYDTRSSGSFIFETTDRVLAVKNTGFDHVITVAGLTADGTDKIRIRFTGLEEDGLGSYIIGNTWIKGGTGDVAHPPGGIRFYFLSTPDSYASKTPGADDFVEWEAQGYV